MRIFCTTSAVPGAYNLEAGMLSTGSVYRWFQDLANTGHTKETVSFRKLDKEAESSPPGANGLLVIPHFKGSGSPYWNPESSGLFHNLTLSTTRGDIARSILEGIAGEISENIKILEQLLSHRVKAVRVSGGMAKSELFNQIQADILGKPVFQPMNWEATALGAWISSAVTTGIFSSYSAAFASVSESDPPFRFEPRTAFESLYREQIERKQRIYHALTNLQQKMSQENKLI